MNDDLISKQAAIRWVKAECNPYGKPTLDYESGIKVIEHLERMPSAQSETHDKRTETHACDLIDRRAAIDAINGLIDRFERILADIRETSADESVCGLCEYDGAYIGQSGDWCNECPGFDKDNCFKLSDSCRERWLDLVKLPSAQPDLDEWCTDCKEYDTERNCCPRFNKVIREALKEAQPEVVHCRDCRYENTGECEHKFGLLVANDENFCSYGERREDNDGG